MATTLIEEEEEDDISVASAHKLSEEELTSGLLEAAKTGNSEAVARFLDDGASLSCHDDKGWTPLLHASFHGFVEAVSVLLVRGADSEYRRSVEEAKEMAEAAVVGDEQLKHPVPVNSPLHWAAFKGHTRTVWLLLQYGFSVTEVDSFGNNALHLAASGGHVEIVRALMTAGVDMHAANWYGNNALALATHSGTREVLQKAMLQNRCNDTKVPFGVDEFAYLCSACDSLYSEEASSAQPSPDDASVASKPIRYCSSCMYAIQEAEAAMHSALVPGGGDVGDFVPVSPGGEEKSEEKKSESFPEEDLTLDDKERLESAMTNLSRLGGHPALLTRAEKAHKRLLSSIALSRAVESIQKRRPLQRRADIKPLTDALTAAKEAGVKGAVVEEAEAVYDAGITECKLLGAVTLCKGITLATHAHDGDMIRLRKACDTAKKYNSAPDLVEEGSQLAARLEAEVGIADMVSTAEKTSKRLAEVIETDAEKDPFLEPPEIGPEGEEVRPQSNQERLLKKLDKAISDLDGSVAAGKEASADEELVASAEARSKEFRDTWKAATNAEVERIAVFEAEKIKRDKRNKRKGKGKKK